MRMRATSLASPYKTVSERSLPLAKQVFDALHLQILTFELKPYQMLSEASVSEMLGVSRTPAREALARLAEKGFVDVLPQRGSQVAPLRNADLETSQFMREALEIGLLRRAMGSERRADLVQSLRKEITLQRTYTRFDDKASFYISDETFHGLIAEYAGLSHVLPEILRMKDHMDRFRHLMVSEVDDLNIVVDQHVDIADAIEAGDDKLAEKQMLTHLRRILHYVNEARQRFPEYFEVSAADNRAIR